MKFKRKRSFDQFSLVLWGIMTGQVITLLICGCLMSWVYLIIISVLILIIPIPIAVLGIIRTNNKFIKELKDNVKEGEM